MGRPVPFRHRPTRLPASWNRYVRPRAFAASRVRLAFGTVLLLGMLALSAPSTWSPPPAGGEDPPIAAAGPVRPVEVADPWAEARRSRALLEAQESAPRPLRAAAAGRAPATVRSGGAVRVIDGDTFDLAGERIRIAVIDTPEVQGRCPYETVLAARAAARTRQLLAAGDFDLHPLPSGRDEDRYGRKLRIVHQGRSVGGGCAGGGGAGADLDGAAGEVVWVMFKPFHVA